MNEETGKAKAMENNVDISFKICSCASTEESSMRRTRKRFANKPFPPCGWLIVCFIEIRDRAVNGYLAKLQFSKSQRRTDIYAERHSSPRLPLSAGIADIQRLH